MIVEENALKEYGGALLNLLKVVSFLHPLGPIHVSYIHLISGLLVAGDVTRSAFGIARNITNSNWAFMSSRYM